MKVTRVEEGVYLVDTMALGHPSTVAVYILIGSKVAIVDCGYASSYLTVLQALWEIGISPSDVAYLIPTHVHLDHGGGTGHLLREMPNARVIAHERGVPHLIDPSRLIESATEVFGEELIKRYGIPVPIEPEKLIPVGEEFHMELGKGLSLTVLHTPGHAPHQISVHVEEAGLLVTADAVGIVYPNLNVVIPTTPPPAFHPDTAIATVGKLSQMDPKSLLVPHFGLRNDVNSLFRTTQEKIQHWVSKIATLKNRSLPFDQIVNAMTTEVADDANIDVDNVPDYARLSIRTSVMGILHYLSK